MSKSQTICLNMIVKNESHIILQTFDNLLKYLQISYWVICDTGSSDNTKEVIQNYFDQKQIKGELIDSQWENFGHNRSEALKLAYNKSDYLLIFDADDSIHNNFKMPEILTKDMYLLKFGPGFTYWRPLIVNNRKKWCFKGVVHEYLITMEPNKFSEEHLEGDYYVESGRSGDRNKLGSKKYLKDAEMLEKALLTETDQGMINRYWFYTGQSYKDGGDLDKAILYYKKVINNQCWAQEQYYSCLMLGDIYKCKNDNWEATKYYLMSDRFDSERVEGITQACEIYFNQQNYYLVDLIYNDYKQKKINHVNKLFVNANLYHDQISYYNSISCFYINKKEKGYNIIKELLISDKLPQDLMNISLGNLQFYNDFLKIESYSTQLTLFEVVKSLVKKKGITNPLGNGDCNAWNELFKYYRPTLIQDKNFQFKNKDKPKVIITFTTCKRWDLFKQTINSILNTWTDIDNIDYWYCVDDNSSEEDRELMKKNYSWIDYYWKKEEEKGHRSSMNLIWEKLKLLNPTYWIHMEDDFLFFEKMDYVTKSIEWLNELKTYNVKQILFNRGYGETIKDYNIESYITLNSNYSLHLHDPDKKATGPNCYYWPHYSFRPSMVEVDAILKIGNFNSENQFFEMDYAHKYIKNGFKSAFYNQISCLHIGRLTSERGLKDKDNAYSLNNTNQFNGTQDSTMPSKKKLSEHYQKILDTHFRFIPNLDQIGNDQAFKRSIEECIDECMNNSNCIAFNTLGFIKSKISQLQKSNFFNDNDGLYVKIKLECKDQIDIPIKIINLEKREDRKKYMVKLMTDIGVNTNGYEFVNGIEGLNLKSSKQIYKMFEGNDFAYRRGIVGCALTHYQIWLDLLSDTEEEGYLILEDDCRLDKDFVKKVEELEKDLKSEEVVFFGYHYFNSEMEKNNLKEKYLNSTSNSKIYPLNKDLSVSAAFAYYISKTGARKMCNKIQKKGIQHGIDFEMNHLDDLNTKEVQPFLAFSDWHQGGTCHADSDIQRCVKTFDFTLYDDFDWTIAFQANSLCERGTTRNLFNYAYYNQELLGNRSIILYDKNDPHNNTKVIDKFKRHFQVYNYEKWEEVDGLIEENKCQILYIEKYGVNDGKLSKVAKNIIHCVFDTSDPHGEYYTTLHKSMNPDYLALPNICCELPNAKINFRKENNIPSNAIVFGRHGGRETFNIPYVQHTIIRFAKQNPDKYFLFLNTDNFCQESLPNLIFLDCNIDDTFISEFIESCDAMIWGRMDGESFGLAIAEFSMKNKPIIATKCLELKPRYNVTFGPFTTHVHLLGEGTLWYNNEESLFNILENFTPTLYQNKELNYYEKYSPYEVMKLFKQSILDKEKENFIKIKPTNFLVCNEEKAKKIIRNLFFSTKGYIPTDYLVYENYNLICNKKEMEMIKNNWFFVSDIRDIEDLETSSVVIIARDPYEITSEFLINDCFSLIPEYIEEIKHWDLFTHKKVIYLEDLNVNESCSRELLINMLEPKDQHCIDVEVDMNHLSLSKIIHDKEMYNCLFKHVHSQILNLHLMNRYQKLFVKMCCNFDTNEVVVDEFCKMNDNKRIYKNMIMVPFDQADKFVIINKPKDENEIYDASKAIIFQMEPWVYDENMNWGVKSWKEWAKPDKDKFLKVFSHNDELNNVQWNMNVPNNKSLSNEKRKNKLISILSYKYFDPGHKKRVDFIKHCESNSQHNIEIYGYQNYHKLKNYISALKDDKKENHYIDYKYALSVENNLETNYATEKIWEPILCECLPFYWGCPNLETIIDERAFVRLDLDNFQESMSVIEKAIRENWWENRIEFIRAEKKKIMEKLGFFPRLHNFVFPPHFNQETYVINLERRHDRKEYMTNVLDLPLQFINAVDGKQIETYRSLPNIKWYFDKCESLEKKPTPSETGCKLSHYSIYKKIIDSEINQGYYLILEDDVIPTKNYKYLLNKLDHELMLIKEDWDIVFLGGQWTPDFGLNSAALFNTHKITPDNLNFYFTKKTNHLYLRKSNSETNERNGQNPLWRTTHAMIISQKGVKNLEKLAREDNEFLDYPIDLYLNNIELNNKIICLDFLHHIFYSPSDNIITCNLFKGDIARGYN